MRKSLVIGIFILVNVAAIVFWRSYFRTLGHPLRWDTPSYVEWDCFFHACRDVNTGPTAP